MRKKYRYFIIAAVSIILGLTFATKLIFNSEPAQKSVLLVGVVSQNKPYSWHNQKKQLIGFDIELAKKIAKKNNMQARFITGSRKRLYSKFEHGKIQLLFLNQSPAALKKDSYYKTDTYLYQPNVLITLSDHKISDLDNLVNYRIALSNHLNVPPTLQGKHIKFSRYSQSQKMLHAVLEKKVRAAVMSDYAYSAALQKEPLLSAELSKNAPFPPIVSQKIFGITSTNKTLLYKINTSLKTLEEDGTLAKLSQKFFNQDWSKQ
ncbi:substrate-binding periplasmic protein [Liquorilactobacillus uvarum]|nr:transporter substrate-binding domain-containing protein [Liquorilactobacillus uvarum]